MVRIQGFGSSAHCMTVLRFERSLESKFSMLVYGIVFRDVELCLWVLIRRLWFSSVEEAALVAA